MILLGALLVFSGFFSASETAITGVNKARLKSQADENNVKAIRSLAMANTFEQSISTILIGRNIVNIAMAAIATKLAMDLFGSTSTTLFFTILLITGIVLVFAEIIPKSLIKRNAEKYLLAISASLTAVIKLFYPITWLFVKFKLGINKLFGNTQKQPTVTDEDVKALVEIGEEEGTFLTQEKELLHNAIEFDDIIVKDILTPRTEVVAVSMDAPIEEVKELFIHEKFSRLPVYVDSIDNVVGIISYRDFFHKYVQRKSFKLTEIIRKPVFVISTAKISNLLKELQLSKVHLAIALDEYGGTAGIVSMEDIVEEIVGEIWDEHDEGELLIEQLSENKVRLDGRMSLEDFAEFVSFELPETATHTLSGWITNTLGYLPVKGERLDHEHLSFYIEEIGKRRIEKVIVEIKEQAVQSA
ncbi:hemolysin family protein [Bacillus horti]|uniref:CBS domain containing-hemolysin-like protein n=2 Tax=Caldalkalibacillus horti TaxID=77523 RepID=A0ABT9W4U8_9BACI|nr:CBS domain containing-hemolysin-like protein [Bacillus horti]